MKKTIQTSYTEIEFRQLIREEIQAALNNITCIPVMDVNEGYLTVEQAADLLKLVKGSIYNLVHKNSIPFHKSGKRILFKRSELTKWMLTSNKVN